MTKKSATLAQQIKAARKAAGLTQHQLGIKIGTTGQTVWTWESGRFEPSQAWLLKLADVLKVRFSIGD